MIGSGVCRCFFDMVMPPRCDPAAIRESPLGSFTEGRSHLYGRRASQVAGLLHAPPLSNYNHTMPLDSKLCTSGASSPVVRCGEPSSSSNRIRVKR
jgi:hypothetical protein